NSFADALIAVLEEAGVTERATVQSFDWRTLQRVQAAAPELATAYLTVEQDWMDTVRRGEAGLSPWLAGYDLKQAEGLLPVLVKRAGGDVWSPYFRDLREVDLRDAHRVGLRVVVWTVNDPADMASLIELGVDGIITDYPDRLKAVLADYGLPEPPSYPRR
ncbi:MAG: glycerophosphodiester phosphodiesterase family protein, partial [Rhodovibrionaceae bacterium]